MPSDNSLFNIYNASDFFDEIVLPQYQQFLEKNSSKRFALLAIIVSYHMYEWVHGDKFTIQKFKDHYDSNEHPLSNKLDIARQLANGTKHFSNKVETTTQTGFSSDFSLDFAKPLNVIYEDTQISIDELLGEIISFWKRQKEAHIF